MDELLDHVYPLLLASAIALGVAPLALPFSTRDDSGDNDVSIDFTNIPDFLIVPLRFNIWTRRIVPFIVIFAVILALIYVYPGTSDSLFTWSFNVVVVSYGLIFIAYIVPAMAASKVWYDLVRERRQIRRRYEEQQEIDLEESK